VHETTTGDRGRHAPQAVDKSEPFQAYLDVPVAGGAMTVAQAGPPTEPGGLVVLGLHGMTGTHMIYRTVARALCNGARPVSLLVPDMRGRGRSADLPEPYGIAAHVADLIAVLDHVGAGRAVVVGHSMGCNVAARLAADHPDRVAAVVLLDGGLPILPEHVIDEDEEDEDEGELHGLLDRFEATFATVEQYLEYWRGHPGLRGTWDEDVHAFVLHDFVVDEDGVRCAAKLKAVRDDVTDVMCDGRTWTSVTRVRAPVRLMRAERGLYDDEPLIPLPELEEFLQHNPHVSAEIVPDVNHFTLVIGGGDGPRRVAATVAELALADRPG
jgi:pimeloyl-ACP methyl ester carboxylesterase